MPSQLWIDADLALRAAEVVYQPVKQAYEDKRISYVEMVAARRQRDAALEVWHEADNREMVVAGYPTLPHPLLGIQ